MYKKKEKRNQIDKFDATQYHNENYVTTPKDLRTPIEIIQEINFRVPSKADDAEIVETQFNALFANKMNKRESIKMEQEQQKIYIKSANLL